MYFAFIIEVFPGWCSFSHSTLKMSFFFFLAILRFFLLSWYTKVSFLCISWGSILFILLGLCRASRIWGLLAIISSKYCLDPFFLFFFWSSIKNFRSSHSIWYVSCSLYFITYILITPCLILNSFFWNLFQHLILSSIMTKTLNQFLKIWYYIFTSGIPFPASAMSLFYSLQFPTKIFKLDFVCNHSCFTKSVPDKFNFLSPSVSFSAICFTCWF